MPFLRPRAFKWLLASAGLIVLAGIGGSIAFYLAFVRDLPNLRTVEDYRPPIASHVLDRHGERIGEFFKERRSLAPMESIPTHLVQAFVAGEVPLDPEGCVGESPRGRRDQTRREHHYPTDGQGSAAQPRAEV